MSIPEGFIFTQGKLQDYLDCQRRFELKYLIGRSWPALQVEPAETFERSTLLGQRFHQMIRQYILGISPERIVEMIQDEEINTWWKAFLDHVNENGELNFIWQEHTHNYPEISLLTTILNYPVIAKFDLVSVLEDRILIIDWKTSKNRPRKEWLNKRMQTKIYPYILVEAGSYLTSGKKIDPGDVEMVYWFPNYPDRAVKFAYSLDQHLANRQYFKEFIAAIDQKQEGNYPLTSIREFCRFCNYRSLCERGTEAGSLDELSISPEPDDEITELGFDIEQIAEIKF